MRDEAENLARLAASHDAQTVAPAAWVIVDNGSTDDTSSVASGSRTSTLGPRDHDAGPADARVPARRSSAPSTRDCAQLDDLPDVIVKLDADISMDADYFERLLDGVRGRPGLGIAGGTCLELARRRLASRSVTGGHVRGAVRALPPRVPRRRARRSRSASAGTASTS